MTHINTITSPELEIDRLVKNSQALLEVLPSMVFLISKDRIVHYMNKAAIGAFGELRGELCSDFLCEDSQKCNSFCPLEHTLKGDVCHKPIEARTSKFDVEYFYLPFVGYEGHHLTMLLMRDITARKNHLLEIENYNKNIESVLQEKIGELNASEKIRGQLLKEVNVLKYHLHSPANDDGMVGRSKVMVSVRQLIQQVAPTSSIILITGESGTGKELIADLLHKNSLRKDAPFLKINCSSEGDSLLESSLFGYEKGAFTGAVSRQKGKFETVDKGTIFLDEIGDISPKMQSSLLRVLQNGELIRVGGTKPIQVDVRVIAATNKDLSKAVEDNLFRLDLFYRLNVIDIKIPPLRERQEDILDLAVHFIQFFRESFKKKIDFVPNKVIDKLLRHDWPGNVRELENVLHRAVLVAKDAMLTEEDIIFNDHPGGALPDQSYFVKMKDRLTEHSLKDSLAMAEKDLIERVLLDIGGDANEARKILQLGKTAFYAKVKKYNIALK